MFQSITLFDFKFERLSTGAWNCILERIEWRELSFALIINYIVWLHFVCWLKENITFIILERYLTPVIERVWSDGYIIFNPMYQNQNIRSLNLSHWKSLARNPTDILRWWSILMFAARPDSDAAQSESMEISVLSLGLHHSGWYHYGPDSWVFREFD